MRVEGLRGVEDVGKTETLGKAVVVDFRMRERV